MSETYRALDATDYDDLFALASDWGVVRQLGGWKWPPDPDQIRARSAAYSGDGFVWAICRQDRVIGTLGLTRRRTGAAHPTLGYVLLPKFHGQGIITRAAARAIDQTFAKDPSVRAVDATTWHDNPASARVLQKLGFVHWQTLFEHALARGVPTLAFQHRLTREDWTRVAPAFAID